MAVKKPSTTSSKDSPSQPIVKPKSRKGGTGKKTKSNVLGDTTNADISALLATAAALQEKLQQRPELAAALDKDRRVKDFMGYCKIEYEKTWKEIPAKVKSNLFEAVRNDQPYLACFQNDWATEELAKQYLKNKRKNAYKNGWLAVPTKYAHLKANAAQRSASGTRGSKAKTICKAREQKKADKAAKKGRKGLVGIAIDDQQQVCQNEFLLDTLNCVLYLR